MLTVGEKLIQIFAVALIMFMLTSFIGSHPVQALQLSAVSEYDVALGELEAIVMKAEQSKAAHPKFLEDLNNILVGLRGLSSPLSDLVDAKHIEVSPVTTTVQVTTQEVVTPDPPSPTEHTPEKASGGVFGGLLKALEDVTTIGELIDEVGSAILGTDAKNDTEEQPYFE